MTEKKPVPQNATSAQTAKPSTKDAGRVHVGGAVMRF